MTLTSKANLAAAAGEACHAARAPRVELDQQLGQLDLGRGP